MIYFVRAGDDGPIKIGRTSNLKQRLRVLENACPNDVTLLGVLPEEEDIHQQFAGCRVRSNGEWFEAEADLLHFITAHTLTSPHPLWEPEFARRQPVQDLRPGHAPCDKLGLHL